MWRSNAIIKQVRRVSQCGISGAQSLSCSYVTFVQDRPVAQGNPKISSADKCIKQNTSGCLENDSGGKIKHQSKNLSGKGKSLALINTLMELKDSKEAVYRELDACVAYEQSFPIGRLKIALIALEKQQQWHRVVQVIKWMLSKGQGVTVSTYGQLVQALDMDDRLEEAMEVWEKKLARDLQSVPWKICDIMISVYDRNDMPENLVKLFEDLESFDRKPQERLLLEKVASAYEKLGLVEKKERVLEKYKNLFKRRERCHTPRTVHKNSGNLAKKEI